jgi:hypothetical protein
MLADTIGTRLLSFLRHEFQAVTPTRLLAAIPNHVSLRSLVKERLKVLNRAFAEPMRKHQHLSSSLVIIPLEKPKSLLLDFIRRSFVQNDDFVFQIVSKPLVEANIYALIFPTVTATNQRFMSSQAATKFGEEFSGQSSAIALLLHRRSGKKPGLGLKQT